MLEKIISQVISLFNFNLFNYNILLNRQISERQIQWSEFGRKLNGE